MKAAWRIAGISVAVLAALLVLLLVIIAAFDWNRAKPWLSDKISAATGREFVIAGDLSVDWRPPPETQGWQRFVPWPHLRANDVKLGNPDWADSGQWMLTAPRVDLDLNLPRLLGRQILVEQLRLSEPKLVFEKQGEERRNWQFTPETPAGQDGGWRFHLERLAVASGNVRYVEREKKTDLDLRLDTRADGSLRWQAGGRYNAEKLQGQGTAGSLLALRTAGVRYPVDAELRIGETRIEAKGSITDPADPSALDIRLKLLGASMADLFPISGLLLPDTPKFSTEGRVIGKLEPGRLDLRYENFKGIVGESDIAGTLHYKQQDPRPTLRGEVVSRRLRLVDLGRLIGTGDDGRKQPGDIEQPKGRVLPVSPFKTDRWDKMDVEVKFSGQRIIRREALPIENFDTRIAMQGGVLTLDPLQFGIAGGRLSSEVRIDGRSDPARGNVRLQARGLNLAKLFPKVGDAPASVGTLAARAQLTVHGNSVAALLGSANGEMSAVVNRGSVSKFVLEAAGLNIASAAIAKIFGDRQIPVNCLVADLDVKQGIARPRVFLLDSPDATIRVTGAINLQGERYDLTIHPDSKGVRLLSLRSPLYVRGSFENPDVGIDKRTVAMKAGAAALLGVAAAPIAGLLALINPGEDAESPCAALLGKGRK